MFLCFAHLHLPFYAAIATCCKNENVALKEGLFDLMCRQGVELEQIMFLV